MHTGRRNQLHLNKLDEFVRWAKTQGYETEDATGAHEVLRLRKDEAPPLRFWKHHGGNHATTDKYSQPLVSEWMYKRRQATEKEGIK